MKPRLQTGETLHSETDRRLFNLQTAIILPWIYCSNHYTMVFVAEMWNIHIEFYIILLYRRFSLFVCTLRFQIFVSRPNIVLS